MRYRLDMPSPAPRRAKTRRASRDCGAPGPALERGRTRYGTVALTRSTYCKRRAMGRKRRGAPSRKVASARGAASDKSGAALRIRTREFCPQRRALGTMRSRRHWGYKKITLRTAAPWWRLSAGRRWALSRSGRGFRRAMTAFPKIVCLCRGERLTATEANSDAQIDSENRRVEGAVKSICKGCRSAIIKDPAPAPF